MAQAVLRRCTQPTIKYWGGPCSPVAALRPCLGLALLQVGLKNCQIRICAWTPRRPSKGRRSCRRSSQPGQVRITGNGCSGCNTALGVQTLGTLPWCLGYVHRRCRACNCQLCYESDARVALQLGAVLCHTCEGHHSPIPGLTLVLVGTALLVGRWPSEL